MRIVAGRFKGRALSAPQSQSIRPTSDRLREQLFNILIHRFDDPITGARALDLFAGTGALGFEALSRGASYCVFIDDGIEARSLIRTSIENFGLTGETKLFKRDASKLGAIGTLQPFDLVFCDPPYGKNLGVQALHEAHKGGWLKPNALIVLEEDAKAEIILDPCFEIIDTRIETGTKLLFIKLTATA